MLAQEVNRGVLDAIAYARSTYPDHLVALSVVADPSEAESIEKEWARCDVHTQLEIVSSPSGEFTDVTIGYIDELEEFGGAGHARLGLARSRDLKHWKVPPG